MSAQLPPQGIDDDADLTAAEYALGVLDAGALRAARRRLRTDAVFAQDVSAWEAYFQPWIESIAAVEAPASAWPRIQASLGWTETSRAKPASVSAPTASPVGFWRGLAFGGFALAAVAAVGLMFALQRPPEQVQLPAPPAIVTTQVVAPDMVASIAGDDGRAVLTASIDSKSGAMTLSPVEGMEMPTGRAAELWLIPAGGAPQSLGVIDPARAGAMTIPETMRAGLSGEALLAVSLEPMGGSPTGQPTGPVVAKGAMHAV